MCFLGLNDEARFRDSSVLTGFSRFYCGGNSAAKAKIRSKRPSTHRRHRRRDHPIPSKGSQSLPQSGRPGSRSGILLRTDRQGQQEESLSENRKFPNSPEISVNPCHEKKRLTTLREYARWSLFVSPLLWSFEATPVLSLPPYCRRAVGDIVNIYLHLIDSHGSNFRLLLRNEGDPC